MMRVRLLATAALLSLLLRPQLLADELRDGLLGNLSGGNVTLTLELLPRSANGTRFVTGTEVVSDLVPEFLASALLASRRLSFGICPPDIYSDGFAVTTPQGSRISGPISG